MGRRIGLLPGTFDPIHNGHVALAWAARTEADLDEVWVLVDPQPAYKVGVLAYDRRLAMVELALDGAGSAVEVAPGLVRGLPHTVAGFEALIGRYPKDRFVFIMGEDMIGRLDSWDGYERAVDLGEFVVAARKEAAVEVRLNDLRRRLGVLSERLAVRLLGPGSEPAAASSVARDYLRRGERPEWLDERVYAYIREHELYR